MKKSLYLGVAAVALSDSFEQQILIDAEAGSAPNIAVFPQPGLAADMAKRGFLTPLADGTGDWIRENYAAGQSWTVAHLGASVWVQVRRQVGQRLTGSRK